jgi:hypothetical protein
MIIFVDENVERSCNLALETSHSGYNSMSRPEKVLPLTSDEMRKFLDSGFSSLSDNRCIVCVNANYQDYIDPRTREYSSRFGLEEIVARIREIRPQTHILVYAENEYPTEKILANLQPDSYYDEDFSAGRINLYMIFPKLVSSCKDVTSDEMKQRGISIEMHIVEELGNQVRITREQILEREKYRANWLERLLSGKNKES